jgi:hypothetical protein
MNYPPTMEDPMASIPTQGMAHPSGFFEGGYYNQVPQSSSYCGTSNPQFNTYSQNNDILKTLRDDNLMLRNKVTEFHAANSAYATENQLLKEQCQQLNEQYQVLASHYYQLDQSMNSASQDVLNLVVQVPTVQQDPVQQTPPVQQDPVQQTPPVQSAPVQQTPPVQSAPVQQTPPDQSAPVQQTPPVQSAPVQQTPPVQSAPVQHTPPVQQTPFVNSGLDDFPPLGNSNESWADEMDQNIPLEAWACVVPSTIKTLSVADKEKMSQESEQLKANKVQKSKTVTSLFVTVSPYKTKAKTTATSVTSQSSNSLPKCKVTGCNSVCKMRWTVCNLCYTRDHKCITANCTNTTKENDICTTCIDQSDTRCGNCGKGYVHTRHNGYTAIVCANCHITPDKPLKRKSVLASKCSRCELYAVHGSDYKIMHGDNVLCFMCNKKERDNSSQ